MLHLGGGGGECVESNNSLNCNNHKWKLANLSRSFTRGREGRLPWQQDAFWKTEWVPLNCKWIHSYQYFYSNFSITLICCLYKKKNLLLYSFTCKCPYSNINSKDFTWCLNIFSLLECKLYFEYWKIHFPSESRWHRSHPNWIADYAKKIGLCNIYWMHIKPWCQLAYKMHCIV